MPMKNIVLALLLALSVALFLTACGSDKKDADNKDKPAAETAQPAQKAEAAPAAENASAPKAKVPPSIEKAPAPEVVDTTPPPSQEELDRADQLVAFANAASMALASGRYAQADVLAAYTKYYLAEWQLAKRPSINEDQEDAIARRLKPPANLFTPEQAKKMSASVQDMNKAISSMRADYRLLEKYVQDASIQDDGVKGKALSAGILKEHAVFIAARDSFMEIVEGEAAPAEDVLLRNHPLKRQIQAAERIFAVFGKTASLLAPDSPDKEALKAQRKELADALTEGGRPPFMAAPDLERQYRGFLKQASKYAEIFDKGLEEEFYVPTRFDMNNAALASRAAYNDFVKAANQLR